MSKPNSPRAHTTGSRDRRLALIQAELDRNNTVSQVNKRSNGDIVSSGPPPPAKRARLLTDVLVDRTSSTVKGKASNTKENVKHKPKAHAKPQASTKIQLPLDGFVTRTRPDVPRCVGAVDLSSEQLAVFLRVQEAHNVFFTGAAGTGKSVLLRGIIAYFTRLFARTPQKLGITAPTGIAACNIGGITIHSWSGIALGKGSPDALIAQVKANLPALNRWLKAEVLIIDEISMMDAATFDNLDAIARATRKIDQFMGGIQVIVTGDFFQLPPVCPNPDDVHFAFEARAWKEGFSTTAVLSQVRRQADPTFINILNQMRLGHLSPESLKELKAHRYPVQYNDGIQPTSLLTHRAQVDQVNQARLDALNTEGRVYLAKDVAKNTIDKKLVRDCIALPRLELKIDTQVMYLKNVPDENLVNGTLGVVVGFAPVDDPGVVALCTDLGEDGEPRRREYPIVRFSMSGSSQVREIIVQPDKWVFKEDGCDKASRVQAWALSIHKAQGQTVPRALVDLNRAFEIGQAYVACSRAVSLDTLQVIGLDPFKVKAHPRVVRWYKKLMAAQPRH